MQISLSAQQPFIFLNAVRSHGWWQLAPFDFDEQASLLRYVLRLSTGKVVDLNIREAPGGIGVEVKGKLSKREQAEIEERVGWMFGLERDFSSFYAAVRHEPKLSHVESKAYGRLLRSPTFFEDVIKTILTTNTLWGATKRMNLNLIAQFGDPWPADPDRKAFPTPERLAAVPPDVLREETRLGYRAPYIQTLAERVASGDLDVESFKTSDLPTLELRKKLMKIKGVGSYAAANLLMILGRGDFIPLDTWALKLVSHEWHDGQPVTPADVEAAFADWGEWKGMAYWFWDWKYQGD
jgi:3-methyladenine DNA glycosylase/8-oxoguanine DNA glycosylase